MKHFPSNKLIIPFVLIGLSVLAFYFSSARGGPTKIYDKQTASLQVQKEAVENPNLDSDNDGLPDWQEVLWKTDTRNPDTDGDGTQDGEETKQNRNPMVKGPDDGILETMFSGDNQNNSGSQMPETFTEVIGQQLLAQLLVNKQAGGGKISTKDANNIADSMLSALDQYAQPGENVYKIADLKTVPPTQENIKSYGNEFGALIKKYFDPIPRSEIITLLEAMKAEDSSMLEELKPISLAYKNITEEILKIKVPESLTADHLTVINNLYRISKEINNMAKVYTDAALAIVAYKQYQDDSDSTRLALRNIQSIFPANNVTFQDNEPGKILFIYSYLYKMNFAEIQKASSPTLNTKNLF